MAFTTRRGRPPRAPADVTDHGTPETQHKRALGLTREPIDLCLERGLITQSQHWCGLHLRWLYTLRYSAPVVTTRYTDAAAATASEQHNPEWRSLREKEYRAAVALLQQAQRYEPVMRLCVYNEQPAFLHPHFLARAWDEPALLARLNRGRDLLLQGLDILEATWKKPPAPRDHSKHYSTDLTQMLP